MQISWQRVFWAENQGNHQNFDTSLLAYKCYTHSEHPIRSSIKFPVYRHPQTAIWGKIGGFRFKSPYREQMLLLLLMIILVSIPKQPFYTIMHTTVSNFNYSIGIYAVIYIDGCLLLDRKIDYVEVS